MVQENLIPMHSYKLGDESRGGGQGYKHTARTEGSYSCNQLVVEALLSHCGLQNLTVFWGERERKRDLIWNHI